MRTLSIIKKDIAAIKKLIAIKKKTDTSKFDESALNEHEKETITLVEKLTALEEELAISDVKTPTVDKYTVNKEETGYVHLRIRKGGFNSETGKALHKSFVHIVSPKEYTQFMSRKQGYNIEQVLHLPKGIKEIK